MKNLKKIIGTGALALALTGCTQTEYEGKIGEEQVKYENFLGGVILTVKKQDGRETKYGQTTRYENNKIEEQVLEKAQKQFDDYLVKIKIAQTDKSKNKIIKGLK